MRMQTGLVLSVMKCPHDAASPVARAIELDVKPTAHLTAVHSHPNAKSPGVHRVQVEPGAQGFDGYQPTATDLEASQGS